MGKVLTAHILSNNLKNPFSYVTSKKYKFINWKRLFIKNKNKVFFKFYFLGKKSIVNLQISEWFIAKLGGKKRKISKVRNKLWISRIWKFFYLIMRYFIDFKTLDLTIIFFLWIFLLYYENIFEYETIEDQIYLKDEMIF